MTTPLLHDNTTATITQWPTQWKDYRYRDNTTRTMTTQLIQWQHGYNENKTLVNSTNTMTTQLLQWQRDRFNDNAIITVTTRLLQWQHDCYNDNTTAIILTQLPYSQQAEIIKDRYICNMTLTKQHHNYNDNIVQWQYNRYSSNTALIMTTQSTIIKDSYNGYTTATITSRPLQQHYDD